MAVYVFIIKTNIKISFRRKNVKFPQINMKIGKNGISPFFTQDGLRAGREKLKPTLQEYIRSPRRKAQREKFFRANLALRATLGNFPFLLFELRLN